MYWDRLIVLGQTCYIGTDLLYWDRQLVVLGQMACCIGTDDLLYWDVLVVLGQTYYIATDLLYRDRRDAWSTRDVLGNVCFLGRRRQSSSVLARKGSFVGIDLCWDNLVISVQTCMGTDLL